MTSARNRSGNVSARGRERFATASTCQRHSHRVLAPLTQRADWDCGITCVENVFRYFCRPVPERSRLEELAGSRSTWTIDLVLLLHKTGFLNVAFWTTFAGINPAFKDWPFYRKAIESDAARVQSRFVLAQRLGIPVFSTLLPTMALIPAAYRAPHPDCGYKAPSLTVSKASVRPGSSPVWIVLVDRRHLRYSCPLPVRWSSKVLTWIREQLFHAFRSLDDSNFQGHYVLVLEYCPEIDAFLVMDPAEPRAGLHVERCVLDKARLAPGTDADIIRVMPEFSANLQAFGTFGVCHEREESEHTLSSSRHSGRGPFS
jgi:hypothetical protein